MLGDVFYLSEDCGSLASGWYILKDNIHHDFGYFGCYVIDILSGITQPVRWGNIFDYIQEFYSRGDLMNGRYDFLQPYLVRKYFELMRATTERTNWLVEGF